MELKKRIFLASFYALIFIYFIVFFTKLHPIILSDTDDWLYAFKVREAIPLWKVWNPSRIFAETLMPVVSEICAYTIYPVTGDFFKSLTFGYAFVISGTITALINVIYKYLFKKYNVKQYILIMVVLFFILCHFWIFRIADSGNNYMFKTVDACTHFYYVIPNIINCIMVIFMINNNYIQNYEESGGREDKTFKRNAFFIILVYFCIFSNIWSSIIIASFIASKLLLDLVYTIKRHEFNIVRYTRKQLLNLIILAVWFISQIFEMNGGRAALISSQSFTGEIFNVLNTELNVVKGMNNKFVICMLVLLVCGLYFIIKNNERDKIIEIGQFFLAFIIMELYLVLSCAKAGSWYISRPDVFYGLFFFVMVIAILCFITIINHLPAFKVFFPLVLVIIFFDCNTSGKTFLESNVVQLPPNIIYAINNDILKQMADAQANGLEKTDIYVPMFNSDDNWPYATYAGYYISGNLYKLGVLDYNVEISAIIPLEEKNKQFHIILK